MSKNNQQQRTAQPQQAPGLDTRAGHDCDGCRALTERVAKLEAIADGLTVMILKAGGFAATVGGKAIPRCECGRFCTRMFTLNHPIAGITTQFCCDECEARSPLLADCKVSEQKFGEGDCFYDADVLAYSRKVNSALESVSLSH